MADKFSDHRDAMPTPGTLLQMVTLNDEKHEEGHGRLRADYRILEKRVGDVEAMCHDHGNQFARLRDTPIEASNLRFTPAILLTIVALCASIIGGAYGSTWGLKEDMSATRSETRDVTTRMKALSEDIIARMAAMDERMKADQKARDDREAAAAKLADERASTMNRIITEVKARGEMTDLKVNNLRETVLTSGAVKR